MSKKYFPVYDSAVGNIQLVLESIHRKGTKKTFTKIIARIFISIRARVIMAIRSPRNWPIIVDQYLLAYSRSFDRTYSYLGNYKNKINTFALFGHFMNITKDLPGDIAEFGVYKGDSIVCWAKNIKLMGLTKKVYGFDSFEGYPNPQVVDNNGEKDNRQGELADTSMGAVQNYCKKIGVVDVVELVKGFYPTSFKNYQNIKFSQSLLNCDLYESHKAALEYVYPRTVSGGIIMCDEYNDPRWLGATKAWNEFFSNKEEKIISYPELKTTDPQTLAYVIKK